ncbi:phosphoribosylglycinamide formyltransferase [Phenylobacterium aquaticum]|uniref:phosphoribosylglycinamide formyltransferase n=1 Tax=Phenylobacterium aquaticum TaxID=1763816 RepID=UPI0026F0A3A5|nr:phosphoribosylglycinamide formyltransferase [Phenylobacterium aquaticum]
MTKPSLKLGFLASRNGSSLRAIVGAIRAGTLDAQARLVVSNNRAAPALAFAAEAGIPELCIPTQADAETADRRLAAALTEAGVELVVLSGYLRRLGPVTLAAYRDRILNIHPGPLPAFGGEGMYGRKVHEAVIAAGAAQSEITIHLVDEEYDHGAVLARRAVPIAPGETADSLEARVTALEPEVFVETLQRIARGELVLP